MALKLLCGASLALLSSSVDLKWSDCGDADTHAKVNDIQPTSLPIGTTTTITGTGKLDKDESGGTFKFTAKVGPLPVLKGSGDLCKNTTIKFPLGAGSLLFHALKCPVAAGDVAVVMDVSVLGASNDLVNINLTADSDSGDKVLCVNINTNGVSVPDVRSPRGLLVENATEADREIARSRQFEKDFEEGQYVSDLNVTRGVTNCNQKCSNWCWATSATMAASAFGGGSACDAEEAKVAGHELHASCDGSCSNACNQGGTTSQIADGIKFLSDHPYTTGGALSQSSLDSALRNGPVVIGVQWTLGGGHAITISGVSGGKYTGHDPEGYAINTNYGGLTTYRPPYAHTYTGKWFGSVYTTSGSSIVV